MELLSPGLGLLAKGLDEGSLGLLIFSLLSAMLSFIWA